MPMFFFHLLDGEERTEDFEGIDLPDSEAAREEALDAAREIIASRIRSGKSVGKTVFEITRDDNNVVLTIPFLDAIVW